MSAKILLLFKLSHFFVIYTLVGLLFVILEAIRFFKDAAFLYDAVRANDKIDQLLTAGTPPIRLINEFCSKAKFSKQFAMSAFALVLGGYALYITDKYFNSIYLILAYSLMFVDSILILIQNLIIAQNKDEAYLTREGVTAAEKIYRNDQFTFGIEGMGELSAADEQYVIVHHKKKNYTVRFRIIERAEDVIEIIKKLQGN